ncbi:MAG: Fic family protein, partial [Steroidobacteraceae bacterium]
MPKRIPEEELKAIEEAARPYTEGVTTQQIAQALKPSIPLRTLQYRLKHLVGEKRLVQESSGRWAKYRIPVAQEAAPAVVAGEQPIPVSHAGAEIQKYLRQPVQARKPAGYNRDFLNSYRPNVSSYLSAEERARLHQAGKPAAEDQPAGTYAKQILHRLLIDLSWNSSRLEGNTYSLLDTKRLIDFGHEAQGKG